jgi:hypothetical protein
MKYNAVVDVRYNNIVEKVIKRGIHHTNLPLEEQLILNEGHLSGAGYFTYQSSESPSSRKAFFLRRIIQIRIELMKKKHCS